MNIGRSLVAVYTIGAIACLAIPGFADDPMFAAASNIVEKARQGAVVAQVKAALMDRTDIRSRYIRVQYDGTTIQLAGFVQDEKQGELIAEIAKRQEENASIITFWAYEKDLEMCDPYNTRVSEQVSDAEIWVKVRAALCGPAPRGILEHGDVQAVDVRHGRVRIFLILDSPPEEIDITPYVQSISGVADVSCLRVRAYNPIQSLTE